MNLTEAAVDHVAQLLADETEPGLFLRVQVRPGGCSGFSYEMFFDTAEDDGDVSTEHQGSGQTSVKVVIDPDSAPLLTDATLDYVGGLNGGFKITNPAAERTCGCGQSFC